MSTPGNQDDDRTATSGGFGASGSMSGSGEQTPPAKASTDGPSGTGVGSPGGIPASIADKLPVDAELLERKPELLVAGAFVGGFLVARVLRRIAGV